MIINQWLVVIIVRAEIICLDKKDDLQILKFMKELKEKFRLNGLPFTLLKRNDIGVPDGLNN
jgi:hypothetical protein